MKMSIFLCRSCKGDAVVHKLLNTDRQILVLMTRAGRSQGIYFYP